MNPPNDSQDEALRRRLAALRADLPEGDFRLALHRRLVEAGPPARPTGWARLRASLSERRVVWPAMGVAAGVVAFLVLAPLAPLVGRGEPRLSAVMASTQVAVVRLNLSADVAVDAARIRVTLPPGLAFWSDGQALAQRDFEWTQPLAPGDNEIPIAVRGQRPGRYRIAIDAQVGGQHVGDVVIIEVRGG